MISVKRATEKTEHSLSLTQASKQLLGGFILKCFSFTSP